MTFSQLVRRLTCDSFCADGSNIRSNKLYSDDRHAHCTIFDLFDDRHRGAIRSWTRRHTSWWHTRTATREYLTKSWPTGEPSSELGKHRLGYERCICHFTKWQIHPFISKVAHLRRWPPRTGSSKSGLSWCYCIFTAFARFDIQITSKISHIALKRVHIFSNLFNMIHLSFQKTFHRKLLFFSIKCSLKQKKDNF